MDLAQATNAPTTIPIGGVEHPVRMLTMGEWGEVQAFLKRRNPSPLDRAAETIRRARAAGDPLDPVTVDQVLDHAERSSLGWPPRVGSYEWMLMIDATDGGLAHVLRMILAAADPSFTQAKAEATAEAITLDEWRDLSTFAFLGRRAAPKKDEAAGTAGGPASPSATTGPPSPPT